MNAAHHQYINNALHRVSTADKAAASRRYFPNGIHCIGANAADIKVIITTFQTEHSQLKASDTLALVEYILSHAQYSEETLLAFGLMNKWVKNHFDERLLTRFEFWLEHYASNWAHVDDLCIKTIYQFLLARPQLIVRTQHWANSTVPWCRRASCVVWVKFIHRKIGKSIYQLDRKLIFAHCDILLTDQDEFVQKSVGWLLKVTSVHHQHEVVNYIQQNVSQMTRATLRYAIEKMDTHTRQSLLSLSRST